MRRGSHRGSNHLRDQVSLNQEQQDFITNTCRYIARTQQQFLQICTHAAYQILLSDYLPKSKQACAFTGAHFPLPETQL